MCVKCSTNGFVSHKLKGGVTAPNAALATGGPGALHSGADEAAAAASKQPNAEDSSGMDLKDWISKPASSSDSGSDSESNKNSATPGQLLHDLGQGPEPCSCNADRHSDDEAAAAAAVMRVSVDSSGQHGNIASNLNQHKGPFVVGEPRY